MRNWLERLLGISIASPRLSVAQMDERLYAAAKSDQVACDILNESRRKRGQTMLRCGEGLPSWEGNLTDPAPSWESLTHES